jgi:hypothetical protein
MQYSFILFLLLSVINEFMSLAKEHKGMITAQEKFLVTTTDGVENHFFLQKNP